MYTCRIYSSRDLDTLLHKVELNWICIGDAVVYIHSQQRIEKCENCSYEPIDKWGLIELQWSEKLSHEWTNVWIVIPLFGALMPLGGVNGNLYWHFTHQNSWGNYWMSFLQLVSSLDKTKDEFNSILPIVSFWPISQQHKVKPCSWIHDQL